MSDFEERFACYHTGERHYYVREPAGTCPPARVRCPYAPRGRSRCVPAICDCFLDDYPDDPFGLHPEAFLVDGHRYDLEGHMVGHGCPSCP